MSIRPSRPWWHNAVVYQLYIRSFADGTGDGIGDIPGLRARLRYLADLGVDAIWINPWYPSPQSDAGYDVADYCNIEPDYGSLADADALIADAHSLGMKVLLDIVPNHTSSEHPWFKAALAGDPAARARYHLRPGKGESGALPPNDWVSVFGGPAWTRLPDEGERHGDWYLHLFSEHQPDLNWGNPDVRAHFREVLHFWFSRGVDGFRIDFASGLAKAAGLPDAGFENLFAQPHPAWDQDGVHEIYREWRSVADSYQPERVFVGEAWARNSERLAKYLAPDELHTAFQFDFLVAPFNAERMREIAASALENSAAIGAPSTWVLSNHDVTRQVTRYGRAQPDHLIEPAWDRRRWADEAVDLVLGDRRARAAILLVLALPGTVYLYQGEELGLPEVESICEADRRDPIHRQSGGKDVGRDGSRVPLPWTADTHSYGFGADPRQRTWLPQPEAWGVYSVERQLFDSDSMLSLYRAAIRLRRAHLVDADSVEWLDSPPSTLAVRRGQVECWLNSGVSSVALPEGEVLLHSLPTAPKGQLPPDSAAWVLRKPTV